MKRLLLFISIIFASSTLIHSQCPPGSDIDSDGDGVEDCIDPCVNVPNSVVGNLSFESDFLGWDIPLNQANFNITQQSENVLHGSKALLVSAPNAGGTPQLNDYNIISETFTAEPNDLYTLKFAAKKTSAEEGDYIGWVFEAENGSQFSFNNIFTLSTDWTTYEVNFSNDPNISTTDQFKIVLRFGTSSVDIAVDRLEVYKTEQGFEPTYLDLDNDGNPDCENLDVSNHPDYNALVALYNSTNGGSWTNNTNWLNTSAPLSTWHGLALSLVDGEERITQIDLDQNNLIGVLPTEIGDLTYLDELKAPNNFLSGNLPESLGNLQNATILDLRFNAFEGNVPNSIATIPNLDWVLINNNNISGPLPDFSNQISNGLSILFISSNRFVFGDFEDQFLNYSSNLGGLFAYAPQQDQMISSTTINCENDSCVPNSDNVILDFTLSGSNNTYQWFKNGIPITGATAATLEIMDFSIDDVGIYTCNVNNSTVTGLTISSNAVNIGISASQSPDYDALVALYNASGGNNWANNTNWLDGTKPLSSWYGVIENNGRVSQLLLNNNNLQGALPPEIGDFTFLDRLDVQGNFLGGNLPSTLGNLQNATWLDLRFNFFDGNIPTEITAVPNLFVFLISNNNFNGTLPDFTNQVLNALDFLYIDNNQFVFADFENEFSNYSTNLGANFIYSPQQFIDVSRAIGTSIGQTVTLSPSIDLSEIGTNVNVDWYTADTIEYLGSGNTIDITVNSTTDYRQYFYFVTSNIVTGLGIESNRITIGPDPSTHPDYNDLLALYNATDGVNWNIPWDLQAPINTWFGLTFDENTNRITNIDLISNNLTGTIPAEIGNMTTLTSLLLFQNNLTGEIPNSIWNLVNLEFLFLGAQESMGVFTPGNLILVGGIPPSISNLQQLTWINLTGIPLTLPLQPELFSLPNLSRLRVVNCGLSGAIPAEFANIEDILASGNNFTGTIPNELLNVTNNNKLSITNNFFDFSDLEPLSMGTGYSSLSYSPQRTQDVEENVESGVGVDITLNVNDTNIDRNEVITALNNQYQWFKDSVAISGANGTSYTITNAQENDSGVYFCRITNPLLPDLVIDRAPITLLVDSALSIPDSDNLDFTLYPNPAQNWIAIKGNGLIQNATLRINDMNGRQVEKHILNSNINSINIEHLQSGVYIINIENQGKIESTRFIKQ